MSKNSSYDDGWQDGYWFGSGDAYSRGYEEGKQDERSRIRGAIDGVLPTSNPSTLWSMVGSSIILVIFGWCFIGLLLLLFWIGGESDSWWFPWIWRTVFWGGIGFVVVMSIVGVIMTIIEHQEAKNPLAKPIDNPNIPLYRKYPPADVIKKQKKR